ncbi:SpaA isopeptide-forming pilin-related protein [Enterococcus pallens]|uniref:LPXTG-domain-containing protein cell wall anchor domain n=1 Tax=Enterococcus pallens ATCC BAA-351 TaxID=1158607 RepID=R2QM44_9ENTE|nr:SpaA isopeptide-forming pilin-related protein [Enterococcus pallens]EOH97642.1 LPXTG-domain-containing protein cell wall anchor domain [Enterococcus pallens ATCC BAA-351]EOU20939.1 hypothetical protein I588_01786 [Enterococcus pallens ATCC BAA-351]
MKLTRILSLLFLLTVGILSFQPATAFSAENAELILHKRVFTDANLPEEVNQAGGLGDSELLKDSYGINGATFGIFEVSEYVAFLTHSQQLSLDEAKKQVMDEAKVLRSDLLILSTPSDPDFSRVQALYPGIELVKREQTKRGQIIDATGANLTEDGIISVSVPRYQNQESCLYLIIELELSEQLQTDQAGYASYLLVDGALLEKQPTHLYTKNFTYAREPYFLKMAKEINGQTSPLKGAQFVLSKVQQGERFYLRNGSGAVSEWLSAKDVETSPLTDSRVKKLVSQNDGVVRTDVGLKSGDYLIEEVATVDGYEISAEAQQIRVKIPSDMQQPILVNGQPLASLVEKEKLPIIYNEPAGGRKYFQKVDEQSGNALAGAKFVICNEETHYLTQQGEWVSAEYGNQHFDELQVITSDQAGNFEVGKLAYGKYALLEIQAPENYYLPEQHFISFEINETSDEVNEPLKIVNKRLDRPTLPGTQGTTSIQTLPNRRLPQTGTDQSLYLLVIGGMCIFLAVILKKKKRGMKDES